MILSHDGSYYQHGTDWPVVVSAPERRTLAIVKATEGTAYVAETLAGPDGDRSSMAGAGLPLRGFYHFSHPGRNSAADEAGHFLATMGKLAPGEIPILDHEVEGVPAAWADEWLARVRDATGVTPWLYLSYAYAINYPSGMEKWPLWVAAYGRNDGSIPNWADGVDPDPEKFPVGPWGKAWVLWQYTSKGTVPGVPGLCDDSVSYHSPADLIALAGAAQPPAPTPPGGFLMALNDEQQQRLLDNTTFAGEVLQEWKDVIAQGGDGDYTTGLKRLAAALKAAKQAG